MVKITCDKCGKEMKGTKRYLYNLNYDFCDDCLLLYENIEKKMSDLAIKMRQECEYKIKEKSLKMMDEFMKGVENEKESI